MEKRARRFSKRIVVVALTMSLGALCSEARASSPDPWIASLLSLGSTAVPCGITASLWATGRGVDEGLRFDLGMATLGLGVIGGPSVGQIYASGGVDAVVTFVLRTITGSIMMVGVGFKARGDEESQGMGTALSLLGGIPAGLLAIYDIVAASSSATAAKRRAGHGSMSGVLLTPNLESVLRCGPIPCMMR